MSISPGRRHVSTRTVQRRWDDVSEWPFQFVILPVLVAFAFCLVLFLGSKHGTRLAAFRTWFPTNVPCRSGKCIQAVTVDSEGGLVTGLSSIGPKGMSGAFSGINGLLRLDTTDHAVVGMKVASTAVDDFGVVTLSPEDQLKYNFDYWLAEGEKLAGQQSKECDANYGSQYLEKWRKARLEWCTATAAAKTTTAGGSTLAAAAASPPPALARGFVRRRLRGASSSSKSNKTTVPAPALAHAGGGGDGGSSKNASSRGSAKGDATADVRLSEERLVPSSITVYPIHDKDAHLIFSVASNTVLDSRSFLGSLPHELPEARSGSYLAACRVGSNPSLDEEFMKLEPVKRWMKDSLLTEEYGKVSLACAGNPVNGTTGTRSGGNTPEGTVDHPVLLLSRFDSTNAYRTVEEVVSAFTSLAVLKDLEVAKKGLQVVLADGKAQGLYLDLWATLSRPYPLRLLSQQPWPANTCLTRALYNTYSGSSIMTSMGVAKKTTCKSSVVIAASLWLRHMMGPAVQPALRSGFGAQRQNKGVVRKSVVWISRRNFEGLAQTNLTPWQDQRRFDNEGEVVLELQREIWRWNDEACIRSGLKKSFSSSTGRLRQMQHLRHLLAKIQPDTITPVVHADEEHPLTSDRELMANEFDDDDLTSDQGSNLSAVADDVEEDIGDGSSSSSSSSIRRRLHASANARCRPSTVFFDLRVVELGDIPFYPDHVQVLGQATVLAGVHSTGLANMIWMAPGKGGVLELHHNSAGNDHYHNQANLLGHKYINVDSDGDRVDLAAAAEGLRKLLDMLGSA